MRVSVEISLYPLTDDFIPPIDDFIQRLNTHSELTVKTNAMSTQVFGEYTEVMRVMGEEMQRTHQHGAKAAFVLKVLGSDLSSQ